MSGDLTDDLGKFIVIRKDCTPIAIATKRFSWKKASARNGANVAALALLVAGTKALRGIFNYGYAMTRCDSVDCVKVGTLPVKTNRDDCLSARSNERLKECRIQIVGSRVDIDLNRLCAQQ